MSSKENRSLRFVQLPPFPRQWDALNLTEEDLRMLEVLIMADPEMGTVVPGTSGIRKGRFRNPRSSKGKSSGYRIYYVYFPEYGMVVLWAIIDKAEKSDLSQADLNFLGQQVARLKALLDRGTIR